MPGPFGVFVTRLPQVSGASLFQIWLFCEWGVLFVGVLFIRDVLVWGQYLLGSLIFGSSHLALVIRLGARLPGIDPESRPSLASQHKKHS